MFDGLDAETRHLLQGEMDTLRLAGGAVLFEEGDEADAVYSAVSGAVAVVVGKPFEHARLVARIGAGAPAGEMSLLSRRPRSATVVALRDTVLPRVTASAFDRLIGGSPSATFALGLPLAERLEQNHPQGQTAEPRTVAIIPQHAAAPFAAFADRLANALMALRGRCTDPTRGSAVERPSSAAFPTNHVCGARNVSASP